MIMLLNVFVICVVTFVCRCISGETTFGVSMTVIPSRFYSIETTLQSWLNQTLPPAKIMIFVPSKYKRFKRKGTQNSNVQNSEYLQSILMKSNVLRSHIVNGTILIIPLGVDYGPASKFMGALWYSQSLSAATAFYPDYWVIGDDDVEYANKLLAKYDTALQKRYSKCLASSCSEYFGMTQFAETYRQQFSLTKINSDGSTSLEPHTVLHIQGVDTFIIPISAARNRLGFDNVVRILEYFHAKCPESFYQDDYIISFLLHVFNVEMTSIRKDDGLIPTYPIEGVTKFNSQMHIDKNVNYREEVTKWCVLNSVQYVYSVANVD